MVLVCLYADMFCAITLQFAVCIYITAYSPNVRSVQWNIGPRFLSTDRASAASRGPCKKTKVWHFTVQTEQVKWIDYLLTDCEVCTEKYLPEVCTEKTEGKYFPVQTEQTRLIRNLLCGFWFFPSWLLTKFCVHE